MQNTSTFYIPIIIKLLQAASHYTNPGHFRGERAFFLNRALNGLLSESRLFKRIHLFVKSVTILKSVGGRQTGSGGSRKSPFKNVAARTERKAPLLSSVERLLAQRSKSTQK